MREIKFRAWIINEEYFYETTGFVFDPNKKRCRLYRMNALQPDGMGTQVFDSDNVILEQFTGLHDKNGKEIYEGDIIQPYFDEKMKIGKPRPIVYEDRMFGMGTEDGLLGIWFNICEVIGNIHENPELLA